MSVWVECFVSIRFDLDIGPKVDYVCPPGVLTEQGMQRVIANAFPDCNLDREHFIFSLSMADCTRAAAQSFSETVADPSTGPTVPKIYGAAYYRQKCDPRVPRGYVQQVLVLLSRLPYYYVHELILRVIAPRFGQCCSMSPDTDKVSISSALAPQPTVYYELDTSFNPEHYTQQDVLDNAIAEISAWPSPHPRVRYVVDLLHQVIEFTTPPQSTKPLRNQQFAVPRPPMLLDDRVQLLGDGTFGRNSCHRSFSYEDLLPLYGLLGGHIHSLTKYWELVIAHEPILALSNTPSTASACAFALASLVAPIRYNGVLNSYFTVQNEEFSRLSRLGTALPFPSCKGFIVAGTNPFYVRNLEGWRNLIVVLDPTTPKLGHCDHPRHHAYHPHSKKSGMSRRGEGGGGLLIAAEASGSSSSRVLDSAPPPAIPIGTRSGNEVLARISSAAFYPKFSSGGSPLTAGSPNLSPSIGFGGISPTAGVGGGLSTLPYGSSLATHRNGAKDSNGSSIQKLFDSTYNHRQEWSDSVVCMRGADDNSEDGKVRGAMVETRVPTISATRVGYDEASGNPLERRHVDPLSACPSLTSGSQTSADRPLSIPLEYSATSSLQWPCGRSTMEDLSVSVPETPTQTRTLRFTPSLSVGLEAAELRSLTPTVLPGLVPTGCLVADCANEDDCVDGDGGRDGDCHLFTPRHYNALKRAAKEAHQRLTVGGGNRESLQHHMCDYFDSDYTFLLHHEEQTSYLMKRLEMVSNMGDAAQVAAAEVHAGQYTSPTNSREQTTIYLATVFSQFTVADDIVRKFFVSLTVEFLSPITVWFTATTKNMRPFQLCDHTAVDLAVNPDSFLQYLYQRHKEIAPAMWTRHYAYKTYKNIYERFARGVLFHAYMIHLVEQKILRELHEFEADEWALMHPSQPERIDVFINLYNLVLRELSRTLDPDIVFVTTATSVLAGMAVTIEEPLRVQFMMMIGELKL